MPNGKKLPQKKIIDCETLQIPLLHILDIQMESSSHSFIGIHVLIIIYLISILYSLTYFSISPLLFHIWILVTLAWLKKIQPKMLILLIWYVWGNESIVIVTLYFLVEHPYQFVAWYAHIINQKDQVYYRWSSMLFSYLLWPLIEFPSHWFIVFMIPLQSRTQLIFFRILLN